MNSFSFLTMWKTWSLAVALGGFFPAISAAQQTVTAALIHHNIKSGGRGQAAADHILDLMNLSPQKGLVLCNESNYARQYWTLPAGWHQIWPANPFEGRGNPTFARDAAATLVSSSRMDMEVGWVYNSNQREPRVYTMVKCQLVANPWVEFYCINVHFPTNSDQNEPARIESCDRLIEESQNLAALPLIICGDFNMGETEARRRIATPIGGKLYSDGTGVDHIILRDGPTVKFDTNLTMVNLGKMGSDHDAMRYNFTFKEVVSSVPDWSLY